MRWTYLIFGIASLALFFSLMAIIVYRDEVSIIAAVISLATIIVTGVIISKEK